uniref:Ubiquitin-like protease family profile domain-containing protein n=1 Tax=viral metagenome TaxID=1070528 RepID=A0A6C0I560_9ZZZZ
MKKKTHPKEKIRSKKNRCRYTKKEKRKPTLKTKKLKERYAKSRRVFLGGNAKVTTKEFRKLNCNPAVRGKTPKEVDTCYTNDLLIKLKDAHNSKNASSAITVNEPKEIWTELKDKMSSCTAEDCWLDQLMDPGEKSRIDKETFAPDQPDDWKGEKNPWLSNFDIYNVLFQYETPYPHFKMVGPTPIDFDHKPQGDRCVWEDLCKFSIKDYQDQKKTKIGIVFNLDEHDKGGSHWVSMFIDLEHNYLFFLDSAGDTMPDEIKVFVDRVTKDAKTQGITLTFYENAPVAHQTGESECGIYAIFFIITMLTLEKSEMKKLDDDMEMVTEPFKDYKEAIKFFKEKRIPDHFVTPFRTKYFNIPDSFLTT